MAATIYDVAQKAGVGIGTVSRVLNNSPNVRPETRDRVLAAIETLKFRPSSIARSLSLRKTQSIGVVAPFFTRPSTVERLRGIEAVIAESEYDLIVYNVETPSRRDRYFQELHQSNRIDGLIIISLTPENGAIGRWLEFGMPVVLVDTSHPDLSSVSIDNVAGGYLAVNHLIQLGHRKIAFVSDPLDNPFDFVANRDRHAGYQQALNEQDLPTRPAYHQTGEHGRREARLATNRLLQLVDPPTAIFAASDTQAFGVMEAARDLGLRVPDDLSIIGFDDVELAEFLGLTTVRQPLAESGRQGAALMLTVLEVGNVDLSHHLLPLELVARNTTARPAVA